MKNSDSRKNTARVGNKMIISVSLPADLADRLIKICDSRHYNRSALVTTAIEEFLSSVEGEELEHGVSI